MSFAEDRLDLLWVALHLEPCWSAEKKFAWFSCPVRVDCDECNGGDVDGGSDGGGGYGGVTMVIVMEVMMRKVMLFMPMLFFSVSFLFFESCFYVYLCSSFFVFFLFF